jgi:hypothetical protein
MGKKNVFHHHPSHALPMNFCFLIFNLFPVILYLKKII